MSTIIDLADLGSQGFVISGPANGGVGIALSSAGDLNGDGFADMIVGAPYASFARNRSREGGAYVLYGHRGGFGRVDLGDFDSAAGFVVAGESPSQGHGKTGGSVSSAGDFNGDGYDDFILGAPLLGHHSPGAAYVIYGRPDGLADLVLGELTRDQGFKIVGGEFDRVGTSVSRAGDVNGDGFDDVIVGSPSGDGDAAFSGAAYVIFGAAGGYGDIDLTDLPAAKGVTILGARYNDSAGASVSAAGDINGDGLADVIIGAPTSFDVDDWVGEAFVVFGKADGFGQDGKVDLGALAPSDGFVIAGKSIDNRTGTSVCSVDINADGYDDVVVGTPGAFNGGYNSGAAYVIYGKAGEFGRIDLENLAPDAGFRCIGGEVQSDVGCSVSSAGDVNGDGFDDLIIGARETNGKDSYIAGEAYVVFGGAALPGTIELSSLQESQGFIIRSDGGNDQVGFSVSGAGDINGDGFADVMVGAPSSDDYTPQRGVAYVIYGTPPTGDVTRAGTAIANTIHGGAGDDVLMGRAGDDVLIGAAGSDVVNGQGGADDVDGGDGDDKVIGGVGDDTIHGGAGDDRLVGGRGDDVLFGGQGRDVLNGGDGADRFHFTATGSSADVKSADRVLDFFQVSHDVIDLSDFDARPGSPGLDPLTFIGTSGFSGAGGELRYAFSGSDTVLSADTDGDRVADFVVRLDGHVALTEEDFLFAAPGPPHPFLPYADFSGGHLIQLA